MTLNRKHKGEKFEFTERMIECKCNVGFGAPNISFKALDCPIHNPIPEKSFAERVIDMNLRKKGDIKMKKIKTLAQEMYDTTVNDTNVTTSPVKSSDIVAMCEDLIDWADKIEMKQNEIIDAVNNLLPPNKGRKEI